MSLSNLSRSIGAWGFSNAADRLDYAESFTLIGGLMIAALITLSFFDMDAHQARLRGLDPRH
jgi:hypothetical protein